MSAPQALTREVVNTATSPKAGECWLADSKVPGFGLRVWKTTRGHGKAFAIRSRDRFGRSVRRTFDAKKSRAFWLSQLDEKYFELGDSLVEARQWALDEINQLQGRLTSAEKREIKRQNAALRVQLLTVEEAASKLIQRMRRRGLSVSYVDRIDKLVSQIPVVIRETPLPDVSPEAVAAALVDQALSGGNSRTLRSFIGQLFKWASTYDGPLMSIGEAISSTFWEKWENERDVPIPQLRNLTDVEHNRLFDALEAESTYWQQALCIRLYFCFGAPLSRLMSAQWGQLLDGQWWPYWPNERVLWYDAREIVDEKAATLLRRVYRLTKQHFGGSRFWFPSKYGRQFEHIRTVDGVWRNVLHDIGLPYYPLREFARSIREPNNPSYYSWFVRYYSPYFRRQPFVIKIAKELRQRRKGAVDLDSFRISDLKAWRAR